MVTPTTQKTLFFGQGPINGVLCVTETHFEIVCRLSNQNNLHTFVAKVFADFRFESLYSYYLQSLHRLSTSV